MHATTSPTLSQPRAGGARFFGAALALVAAVTAGALIAVNLPAASTGTTAGAKTGPGIHSADWLRNHHRGAAATSVTAAERSLLEQRRGEIGALGAPGAAQALQTPASSALDYWRAYAAQRATMLALPAGVAPASVIDAMRYWKDINLPGTTVSPADPKAGASFMGGVPGYAEAETGEFVTLPLITGEAPASVLDQIRADLADGGPLAILPVERSSVPDSMSYWNSLGLSGTVTEPSIPAVVYSGKTVDPVAPSRSFAPLVGDWILTAPSPFAAPYMPKATRQLVAAPAGDWVLTAPSPFAKAYMPKLAPQGINHPVLPSSHGKILVGTGTVGADAASAAAAGAWTLDQIEDVIGTAAFESYFGREPGNDTPRGISHR